jgi:demethylmenaquinone methyltransferase/2-methoxy-6-polyprenyl-1,4-benzoquinol methylase
MRYYPDSKVELQGFAARYYDSLLNMASLGFYSAFIKNAIAAAGIKPGDRILDLGAGTGRNALLMNGFLRGKGKIVGMEISAEMLANFSSNTREFKNIEVINRRIDQPFELAEKFDKAFISFVIHGFPQPVREVIIRNVFNNLKDGGEFIILDFNEFIVKDMPFWTRIPFTTIECKYAFDFVERDWKKILSTFGFDDFQETNFMMNYVRLLKARKGYQQTGREF